MAISLLTVVCLGTLSLLATMLLGYRVSAGSALVKTHFLAAFASTTLLVMGHAFILFFLIATGVELKDMEKSQGWGDSFRRRTTALKSRVFPLVTLTLLLVMANFILGAAAHTRALPPAVHEVLAWTTLLCSLLALHREYRALGDNNRLIAEAGARRAGR
ncbi:MAG TPA: hypothetical protein VFM88_23880 [Vicinamibacteria bacterium]|nr:hypothetical protein [Vicinamibacteria bacterium]